MLHSTEKVGDYVFVLLTGIVSMHSSDGEWNFLAGMYRMISLGKYTDEPVKMKIK